MRLRAQLFILFSVSLVAAIGAVGYFFYKRIERLQFEQLRYNLTADAHAVSMLIDGDKHVRLAASGEMNSPGFSELLDTLREFKKTDARISEAYTMVETGQPGIWKFVVDSAEAVDKDGDGVISELEGPAPLGEEYEVSDLPEMRRAFEGPIADREINRDKWGWWLSAYAPVYNSRGDAVAIVGLDISADTIWQEQARLRKIIIVICVLFIPVALVISDRFSHSLSKPIYRMVEAAREIGRGNYRHRTGISKRNEIGFLAQTMDSMAENIRRSFDKLSTLNRTGNILTSTLDLEQALKISLNLALEVTRSTRGAIFLLGYDDRSISIALTEGIEAVRGDGDEYIMGSARMPAVLEEDREAQIRRWLEVTGCTRCFPLTVKENQRGFFLLNPEIKDEEFLDTLMSQVALAIENARLFHDAITDSLTGLYLKRYFQIQLDTEVKRSQRHGRPLSFMMLDIDNFKEINDTHGHPCGDYVLKEISGMIKELVRGYDIVGRYGGEEIAVILPETASDSAEAIAERIRDAIERRWFVHETVAVRLTASIGVFSTAAGEGVSSGEIIKRADDAMYRAKKSGKNKVCAG